MNNYMKVEFVNKSDNERLARNIASIFATFLDPTIEEISEIKTAISEAVTNAIIHGYENSEGIVTMECFLEDNTLKYIVSDSGVGINNLEEAMQPLYTGKPEMERSGMGFTIMQTFMDSVNVISEPNVGTKVVMIKTIATRGDTIESDVANNQ